MTWAEYITRLKGFKRKQEHEWDMTRRLAVTIINMNVAKKSDMMTYEDWMPLERDKKRKVKPNSSVEEFEKAKRKLDANNIRISSTVKGR